MCLDLLTDFVGKGRDLGRGCSSCSHFGPFFNKIRSRNLPPAPLLRQGARRLTNFSGEGGGWKLEKNRNRTKIPAIKSAIKFFCQRILRLDSRIVFICPRILRTKSRIVFYWPEILRIESLIVFIWPATIFFEPAKCGPNFPK
jgi:hypothetical protein